MFQFFKKNLTLRLAVLLFIGAVFSILTIAIPIFHYSKETLREGVANQLVAMNKVKKAQILNYLKEKIGNLNVLSGTWDVMKSFELLQAYHNAGGGEPQGIFDTTSKEYKSIYEEIDPFFKQYVDIYDYYDIFLLCRAHGHVMYTVRQEPDLGTNLKTGTYKNSALSDVWQKVLKEKKAVMGDFAFYAPSSKPSFFLGAPVFDQNKDIIAVVGLQLVSKEINVIVQEQIGMGASEETYLVGEDSLMRSDSRFEAESVILKKKVKTVSEGIRNLSDTEMTKNYRGDEVLIAHTPLLLNKELGTDFDWIIISEINEAEAFAPIKALQFKILWIGIILSIFSGMAGYFIARSIARPLKKLSDKAVSMASGDLTITITHGKRADEIGSLISAFYYMLSTLRNQTQQIIEGTNTIASSISQISATATQLATSSAETSTSISEITTTVEEVRQTVQVSSEKAEKVADGAEQGVHVSEAGRKATEDAISGMNRIKQEMEYVAESIVKLSEQTQSIGEIISAVNDLADQSNLLSVNAAIEAAKAGEHGKGFAVVAQEVKSLADQSKEATNQVRSILNDIQKATSAAVMATERGSKAVENGVKLAIHLGNAIDTLSNSVMESAQAAVQIAASSNEQLVGMEQLVHAMENIKEASIQNVDGAKQLESAVKNLDEVGKRLKDLAGMFKL